MRSKSILLSATAILVVLGLCNSTLIADLNEGLISHWKFDEGSGAIAYDSNGTNDGTIYGAQWTDGVLESALSFDGVDDYVDLGNSSSLKPPLPVTLCTWINLSNVGKLQRIVVLDEQLGFYYGIWFYVRDYDNLGIGYGDGGPADMWHRRSKVGTTELSADTWYHVAAVINGPTDINLYINGVDDGGIYSGSGGSLTYSTSNSYIGSHKLFNEEFFDGSIDDVRIYDRALSAVEIQQLYVPADSGPIAHWKFDEGSGTTAYDSAGDNDGTIYGAQWTAGQINGALSFDGVNDYVDVGNDNSLMTTGDLTIYAWIKARKSRACIYSHSWTGWGLGFGIGNNNYDGRLGFYTWTHRHWIEAGGSLADDTWHQVAATLEGTMVRLYTDGIEIGSDTGTPAANLNGIGLIGLYNYDWFFGGIIDDVRIFNRALSAEEIRDIYVSYPTELRDIDIKPGSCPNPLNVKSRGLLPVAVLGSEDFDVTTVDIASIRLAGVAPIRSSYEDVATPVSDSNECECSTEGPDGFLDLTLKFETQGIVEALGEVGHGDELILRLTGVLSDETPIEGSDCVIIRGKHKPINKADFNGDGTVDMADFAAFAENWLQSSIVEY